MKTSGNQAFGAPVDVRVGMTRSAIDDSSSMINGLFIYLQQVLGSQSAAVAAAEWWMGVPLSIRQAAAARRQSAGVRRVASAHAWKWAAEA
jgi:hypothetical protein